MEDVGKKGNFKTVRKKHLVVLEIRVFFLFCLPLLLAAPAGI